MPKAKLPSLICSASLPEGRRPWSNLADWVEVKALLESDGNASQEDLARALEQAHAMDEDRRDRALAGDVFKELVDRQDALRSADEGKGHKWEYPFRMSASRPTSPEQARAKDSKRQDCFINFLLVSQPS